MLTTLGLTLQSTNAVADVSFAQGPEGGASIDRSSANAFLAGGSFFFFSNDSKQGGRSLPSGSDFYSQFNVQYNLIDYFCGAGLVYAMDKIGETQSNSMIGAKLEAVWKGYYLELGYGQAEQEFTGRAVKKRSGTQLFYGGGMRFQVLLNIVYFDGGLKVKTTNFDKQDGAAMANKIEERLTMPYIGVGISI